MRCVYKPSRAYRKAVRKWQKERKTQRLYRVDDVITETGDHDLVTIILSGGVKIRGHWYEDHMLNAIRQDRQYRKLGELLFEEVNI